MPTTSAPVQWEIAEDENFSRSARSGTAYAIAAEGHSVHVEFEDLPANRIWYYREPLETLDSGTHIGV